VAALLSHRSQHETTLGIANPDAESRLAVADDIRRKLAEHGDIAGVELGESFHRLEV
jgi:hypothetical protein